MVPEGLSAAAEAYPHSRSIVTTQVPKTPYPETSPIPAPSDPGGTSIDRFPLMHPWSDTSQKGDLNGDDQITPADAAIAVGGSASCDPATLDAADVSGDNHVTSLDALMILQAAAGAIEL